MADDDDAVSLEMERLSEKTCTASSPPLVSIVLKPHKTEECSNQAVVITKLVALSPVVPTRGCLKSRYASNKITATLENESVWSRFHSMGTEMILTMQGRRMFPCCRFRLSGLDPESKYLLVMDIVPLDGFTHKWNGNTWVPMGMGEPQSLARVSVHPESPAMGQQWMESPVSFYKVKLTNNSADQEGCLILRPMHRYQPRLHIVPYDGDSKDGIPLNSPNVQMFTFPKTEFYAVTSYQNPHITQLKIDCNPFAMAFRKDGQSIRLLQDKLGLCSSGGRRSQSHDLNLPMCTSEQRESALKHSTSPCVRNSKKHISAGSPSSKERERILKMKNVNYLNGDVFCKVAVDSSPDDRSREGGSHPLRQPRVDEHVARLNVETNAAVSVQESLKDLNGPIAAMYNTESLKHVTEDAIKCHIGSTHSRSPTESTINAQNSQSQERIISKASSVYLPEPSLLCPCQMKKHDTAYPFRCKHFQRARKAKSNVKYSTPPPVIPPLNVSLQPDLEDVEGMLFVSFAAKEALDVHVQNMDHLEAPLPPPETKNQLDTHEDEVTDVSLSVKERIPELESTLLLHLKQQKHRQVIHPLLQEVGMKLNLLNSTVDIDLQYLGVRLPFPPPVHNSLDEITASEDGSGSFVSRTGKTNDPTKIKGWREKFNTKMVQSGPEGLRNNSAFCSDLLDEYLENEAQQISERVAVLSNSSSSPVSYQLPSKSSSYVVTLDSLLKSRSVPVNKIQTNTQTKPAVSGSPRNPSHFCTSGSQHGHIENRGKDSSVAHLHVFAHEQPAMSTVQGISSSGPSSRSGLRKQPIKNQLRWNGPMTPAKMQILFQDMEEEAFFNGKVRTHITTERANFALSSLLTAKKSVKATFNRLHEEVVCPEEFCRLGCICDSLQRKSRGPTHCRRVECMFDCNCFKHKVLLIHPPKVVKIQRGRKRALMAFPIADPEKGDRPPPATSVTTLWKHIANKHDPEPVFIPKPAPFLKSMPLMCTSVPRHTSQSKVQEEDKDPVYLYFESMMTCARVREYNSNPPPQMHMFPSEKAMQRAEKSQNCVEVDVPLISQKSPEETLKETAELPKTTASAEQPDEPEPTKLLEILSECNWEPHRNLVLNALFWRISKNLLAEPFFLGMYKMQLLSTTLKKGESGSTLTYKVCVSRSEETKLTSVLQPGVKKRNRGLEIKKGDGIVSADMICKRTGNPLVDKLQNKLHCKSPLRIFPLLTYALPTGYLKADKKKPGEAPTGLIKVNSKAYNQAKLLLGQMGALNPANRFAAFATGRLRPKPQDQPKVVSDVSKSFLAKASVEPSSVAQGTKPSPLTSRPHPVNTNAPNVVSEGTRSKQSPLSALSKFVEHNASLKEDASISPLGAPPGRSPVVPAGSSFVHMPVTPSSASTSSKEMVKTPELPPAQDVVLHHLPGLPGTNFICQYNGQVIQLVPVATSDGITPQVVQTGTNRCLPKDNKSVQKPLNSSSTLRPLPKPFPVIAPKILSLSGSSGMNIASGTPAFNVQTHFPGRTGTFSFRICPPNTESMSVGSEQCTKPPDPLVSAPSALILPGGFTLIKLPAVPAVPAAVTSTTSLPAELPQKDECIVKPTSQSSPSNEQKCQASESNTRTPILEKSNINSASIDAGGLSHDSSAKLSDSVGEKVLGPVVSNNKVTPGKHDWVPAEAQMILKDDDCESENVEMDDWPPKGAEQILWVDEDSADEDANEHLNKKLNKNSDDLGSDSTGTEGKKLKTTESNDTGLSACDACSFEDSEVSKTPYKTRFQAGDKAKHNKSKLSTKGKELLKEPCNEAAQTVGMSCSPKVSQQALVEENSLPFQTEPHQQPTHTDLVANQNDISKQGSSAVISKGEAFSSVMQNHFAFKDPGSNASMSSKIDRCSDPPQINSCSDHSVNEQGSQNILPVISKQEPNNNLEPTLSNHSDLIKQNLETSAHVLCNKELCNIPESHTECLQHHCFDRNKNISGDDDDDVDIDGDDPYPLLEGQTPAGDNSTIGHLPNHGSKRISEKSRLPLHSLRPAIYEIGRKFNKPRDGQKKNSPENSNKLLQFKNADREQQNVDEQDDVCQINTKENGDPSSESDSTEGDSSDENSSNDEEDSSNDSDCTSNSETTDGGGTSDKEDDIVDIETFEENQENMVLWNMKDEVMKYRNAKKAAQLRKQKREALNRMEFLIANEQVKRQNHTVKERVRRGEMKQSFALLKRALNVEDQIKMCKHDILIQARLMIRALEKRSKTLEDRKKALLDRQSASISMIAQLSGKTEEKVKINFKESCAYEMHLEAQNIPISVSGSQKNLRGLYSAHNKLPRLGLQKSNNRMHKRSQKPCGPSSVSVTGNRKKSGKMKFKKNCDQEQQLDVQNQRQLSLSRLQINPRRIDSQGNRLPPRLGMWKSINYIRKRSKKSSEHPSVSTKVAGDQNLETCLTSPVSPDGTLPPVKTGEVILKLIAENPGGLPVIPRTKSLSTESISGENTVPQVPQRSGEVLSEPSLKPELSRAEKRPFNLPKIVLQSFGKISTGGKLMDAENSLPNSTQTPESAELLLDPQKHEVAERVNSTWICEATESCSVSEDSNKENPSSAVQVNENPIESSVLSELEKGLQDTASSVKVRKKRSKNDVIIEDALSNPDALGPRMLRNRSPAVSKMCTRSTPGVKRRRII